MSRWPLNNPPGRSNGFGVPDPNAAFGRHAGIDWPVGTGTPVYAAVSGDVTTTPNDKYHGNKIDIKNGDKWYRVMHLKDFVVNGGHVNEGDLIGHSNNTGLSTGPHLHFDIRTQQVPTSFAAFVDPDSIIGKEGEEMQEWNDGDIKNLYKALHDHDPTDKEVADYKSWLKNNKDVLIYDTIIRRINELKQSAQPVGFKPYVEPQLYVKE